MITSRLALLRHLWAMMQTRGEAASLVLRLQRDALVRGATWYAAAAMAAMTLMFTLVLLVALGTPEQHRVVALAALALVLLVTAVSCVIGARRQLARDAGVIADFTSGLRLDLAMVNLAWKDAAAVDDEAVAEREDAKATVREAVGAQGAAPGQSAADLSTPGVTVPDAMTRPGNEERAPHGTP